MRVLLMIGNANMGAREVYASVLRERYPGWGVSNMSALPSNPAPIVKGYNAIVYEMLPADDPRRYRAALGLWEEIKGLDTTKVITRIEGPFREGIVAELEGQGVIVVGAPFSLQAVAEAFERVAPPPPRSGKRDRDKDRDRGKDKDNATTADDRRGGGLGRRLRGLFGHGGQS